MFISPLETEPNSHVLLQVEEGDGVPVAGEGVLADVGDVVGAQV